MNHAEIVDLLTLAAVYDQRTGGEADVRGWHAVAQIENWTAPIAQRVLIEHYSRVADRPRITPAAISDGIRDVRRKAAASFAAPDVPENVTGREYPLWYRTQLHDHIDRVLDAWAAGEPIPATLADHQRVALSGGINMGTCPDDLRDQIITDMARTGRPRLSKKSGDAT